MACPLVTDRQNAVPEDSVTADSAVSSMIVALTGRSGACLNQNASRTLNRILLLCEQFYSMEAVPTDLVKGRIGQKLPFR